MSEPCIAKWQITPKTELFGNSLIGNVTLGQKASLFWAIGAGRFLQTAGLFLFGLYIGRKELFVTSESHLKFWTKALIIAAIQFRSALLFERADHAK